MGEFVKMATVSEIPPGEMTIVELDGQEIAIANLNGEFVAFQNECTHRGGPLGEGILMGDVVECPFTARQFNVRTGAVVSAPPPEPVRAYGWRVRRLRRASLRCRQRCERRIVEPQARARAVGERDAHATCTTGCAPPQKRASSGREAGKRPHRGNSDRASRKGRQPETRELPRLRAASQGLSNREETPWRESRSSRGPGRPRRGRVRTSCREGEPVAGAEA